MDDPLTSSTAVQHYIASSYTIQHNLKPQKTSWNDQQTHPRSHFQLRNPSAFPDCSEFVYELRWLSDWRNSRGYMEPASWLIPQPMFQLWFHSRLPLICT